jgi:ribonucleoside-diphosphate reductase alpha chain
MGLEFVSGYRELSSPKPAQTELPMPGLMQELKKAVNRPVPDLPLSEETELIVNVKARNGNGGNGNGHAVTSLSMAIAHFQQDAPICPSCGHVAVRNGACYKCLNCGESLGCS